MTPDFSGAFSSDRGLIDALELELRKILGVRFVSFAETEGTTVIELIVDPGADDERILTEARHLALVHLDVPLQIEIIGAVASRQTSWISGRVRLLLTVPLLGGTAVEIHLAHEDRTVTIETAVEGCRPVADAIIDGLRRIGLATSYEVVGAQALSDDLGSGTLVVLRDPATGTFLRGLATGRDQAESTARAVLNALNRSLHPEAVSPRD